MKNYYKILEVDKNASQEVIEKAYKALVKKYHPDLQKGQKQQEYSEKMKIINEAYDILSDSFRRGEYNQKLKDETISKEQHEKIMRENYELRKEINRMEYEKSTQQSYQQPNRQLDEGSIINISRILNEQIRSARRQAYHDAYIQDMQNRGYRIRYKHDLKYYLKLIMIIIITIFIFFLIYQIPVVKNYFENMYNENIVFKTIIDIFKNTFSTKF